MKSIEDTICEIDERLASERDRLREECDAGASGGHLASIIRGYLDALMELKEWILEL